MSLVLLYNEKMEKLIFDKKAKEFVKKEFIALCNSVICVPKIIVRVGNYKGKKDDFKFTEKSVSPKCIYCPDCGSVLLWRRKDYIPRGRSRISH